MRFRAELSPIGRLRALLMASACGAAVVSGGAASAIDIAAVVGVNREPAPEYAPAPVGASADVAEFSSFLRDRQGFAPAQVVELVDAPVEEFADLFSLGGHVGRLETAAGRQNVERAVLYYSGPGVQGEDGRAYLVDGEGGELAALDDVLFGMFVLGAEEAIVVLESDFDGATIRPPEHVTVVLAADQNVPAGRDPITGMGLFTLAMLDGATAAADLDGDGVVTAGEAADYSALALAVLANRESAVDAQRPGIAGDELAGLFRTTTPRWNVEAGGERPDGAWLDDARALRAGSAVGAAAVRLGPTVAADDEADAPRRASDVLDTQSRTVARQDTPASRPSNGGSGGGGAAIGAGAAVLGGLGLAAGGGGGGGGGTSPPPSPPPSPPAPPPPPPPPPAGDAGNNTFPTTGPLSGALTSPAELFDGDDLFNLGPGGTIPDGLFVDGGPGSDRIALVGAVATFDLGLLGPAAKLRNFETLNIAGRTSGVGSASLTPSALGDALALNGVGAINVVGDDGADLLAILGALTGDVALMGGADELYILGSLTGSAALGAGADLFQLDGGSFKGTIDGGADDDVFMLVTSAFTGALSGGPGADSVLLGAGANALNLSQLTGFELLDISGAPAVTLSGAGAIASVLGGAGADAITVTGALTGGIDLLGGADSLTLGAGSLLTGGALLGAGDDVLALGSGAAFTGVIDGGADANTIALLTGFNTFNLSQLGTSYLSFATLDIDATGSVTLTGSNTAAFNVLGGASANVVTLQGALTGSVNLAGGNDSFVIAGGTVSGVVNGGAGIDTLSVLVTTPTYDLSQIGGGGAPQNFINFESTGIAGSGSLTLTGTGATSVLGSDGADQFTLQGALTGGIDLLGGADRFTLSGGSIAGFVSGGDGVDALALVASQTSFDLTLLGPSSIYRNFETLDAAAPATLTLNGANATAVTVVGDANVDAITVTGTLTGGLNLLAGADTFTLSGTLIGTADLGAGADTFTLNGGTLTGSVDGGADADTLALVAAQTSFDLALLGAAALYRNFETLNASQPATLTLSGANGTTISVVGDGAVDSITVTGTLTGSVDLAGGNDTFTLNGGTVSQFVDGGAGTDILALVAAQTSFDLAQLGAAALYRNFETLNAATPATLTLSGANGTAVTVAGDGNADLITITGTLNGAVNLLAGNDTFTLGGGSVTGVVDGGADTDTLALGAGVASFNLAQLGVGYTNFDVLNVGAPTAVTLSGSGSIANVNGDDSSDSITITGTLTGAVNLLGGDDTFTLGGGSVTGIVDGGANTLTGDTLALGAGSPSFNLSQLAGVYVGFEALNVAGPAGVVTLSGTGGIANVNGDANADAITITGTLTGDVNLSGGDNELTINALGGLVGNATFGGGVDVITLLGTLTGNADLGDGNDTFVLAGGTVIGTVDGGGGVGVDTLSVLVTTPTFNLSQIGGGGIPANFINFETTGIAASGALTLTGTGAIGVTGSSGADQFTLDGHLEGNLNLAGGADTFTINATRTLMGDVLLGVDADTFTLSGTLIGTADLGAGADTFTLNGGTLAGFVDGGADADTLALVAAQTSFDLALLGPAALYRNFETLNGAAPVTLTLSGANGTTVTVVGDGTVDNITVTGTLTGSVDLAGGNDTFILNGGTVSQFVDGGAGTDILALVAAQSTFNLAQLGLAALYRNFETLNAATPATLTLSGANGTAVTVVGDANPDALTITGTLDGAVNLLAGNDTFTLGGGSVTGVVDGGADTDTLALGAGVASFNLAQLGVDYTNFDVLNVGAPAAVTLSGSGSIANVNGDDSSDSITITGTLTGAVNLLGGNDTFTLGGGSVTGVVDGGADTDTLALGAGVASFNLAQLGVGYTNFEVLNVGAPAAVTLTNTGSIASIIGDANADNITVTGTLTGNVNLAEGANELTINALGGLVGDATFGGGVDVFTLLGTLTGNANLGGGNDTFVIADTTVVNGSVDGGLGTNTLSILVTGPSFNLTGVGGGGASFTNFQSSGLAMSGALTLTGANVTPIDVTGSSGADQLTLQGTLTGNISLLAGADTFTLDGGSFTGFVDGGADADTLALVAAQTSFDLALLGPAALYRNFETLNGAAPVTLTLSGANGTTVTVVGDGTVDNITVTGTLTGSVDLAGGNDTFILNGGTVSQFVDGGAGTDILALVAAQSTFNLAQLGPAALYRNFETLNAATPATLTLSGANGTAVTVVGDANPDALTLTGSLTGGVNLLGGADTLTLAAGGSLAGTALFGAGADTLVLQEGGSLTGGAFNGEADVDTFDIATTTPLAFDGTGFSNFEILRKSGVGSLTVTATGFSALDIDAGLLTFSGALAAGSGSLGEAPISVASGATFAASGLLSIPAGGTFTQPDAVRLTGGALSPGGAGVVSVLQLTAATGVNPVLGFYTGAGGPAGLLIDWGGDGLNDTFDTVDVTNGGATGQTVINDLTVTFTVLPGASIDDLDAADLILSDAIGALGTIGFAGMPGGLTAAPSIETVGARQALRISFSTTALAPLSLNPVTTLETLEGGALLTDDLLGGALDAAGGLASSGLGSSTLAFAGAGWAPYGTENARAGVTRRAFLTDIGGVSAHATAEATRSFLAGSIFDGRATLGIGSGVEQVSYLADGDISRDRLTGRTQAGYVAGFLGAEFGGWRIAAASDIGRIDMDFDSPALGGHVSTSGRRMRAELQASQIIYTHEAPLKLDVGVRYANLSTSPYRRDDGLWAAGPAAEFATASFGIAGGVAFDGLVPYAQFAEPLSGEGEAWRQIGVRLLEPSQRFSFDASIGEVREPYEKTATRGELRLTWRY
jgi:hypothetical protein